MIHPKPKKQYGQHFLRDPNTAKKICNSLELAGKSYFKVLEVGPGEGILTPELVSNPNFQLWLVEVDPYWAEFLKKQYPDHSGNVIHADILKFDFSSFLKEVNEQFGVIGNFPYNIANQILIRILENWEFVPELVGMFQKEVAQRLSARPGNKQYGLLSVILQSYYFVEILFGIPPGAFYPPPKVQSSVIRCVRKEIEAPNDLDFNLFFQLVKMAFQKRRKKLTNGLKDYQQIIEQLNPDLLDKRPEEITPEAFQQITRKVMAYQ